MDSPDLPLSDLPARDVPLGTVTAAAAEPAGRVKVPPMPGTAVLGLQLSVAQPGLGLEIFKYFVKIFWICLEIFQPRPGLH